MICFYNTPMHQVLFVFWGPNGAEEVLRGGFVERGLDEASAGGRRCAGALAAASGHLETIFFSIKKGHKTKKGAKKKGGVLSVL